MRIRENAFIRNINNTREDACRKI